MDNNKLKVFAQETRLKLIKLVRAKLQLVLTTDTAELRGRENDVRNLRDRVGKEGEDAVVEEMAYTWFNRIMALRFMDANGYNRPMVVTPADGASRPEILADALSGSVNENLNIPQSDVNDLLQGRSGDSHPQETLYRRLLIAKCNELGSTMPFLFEKIKDYTELLLPDDLLSELSFVTDIRNGMSTADCLEHIQIVGWLYQFYITDRKQDAETKKSRKGGLRSDEQAAATQLFTPDWIVRYMVENTLGRIWLTLHPDSQLRQRMKYYINPAGNQSDPIPEHIHSVKDIRFIDPCMGSGHVLVYAFSLFAQMYEEEGYQRKEIPNLIFENNLYGLDIDRRCYQLASFALTMAACGYASRRYLRHAEAPKLLALQPIAHDVIASTGDWQKDSLVWQFEHIDTIGSLLKITPEECAAIKVENSSVFGHSQQIMKTQAEYLSRKYDCVVTNPPYLGKGMGNWTKEFCSHYYPIAKSDLYSAFILRCLDLTISNGFSGMVTMESWMFLSTFEELRKFIIENKQIRSLSHFDWNIMRIAFGTVAFIIKNCIPNGFKGIYSYLDRNDINYENETPFVFPKKDNGRFNIISQQRFLKLPGYPLGYWVSNAVLQTYEFPSFLNFGKAMKGLDSGNNDLFVRNFWEVASNSKRWKPYCNGGPFRKWYGDTVELLDYENNIKYKGACVRNKSYYFKLGFEWSRVNSTYFGVRKVKDAIFGGASQMAFINNDAYDFNFFLALYNTKIVRFFIKFLNPTVLTQAGDINRIPIKYIKSKDIHENVDCNVTISKLDWDSHETSWDFAENPLVAIMKAATTEKENEENESEIVSKPDTMSVTPRHDECHSVTQAVSRRDTGSVTPRHEDYQSVVKNLQQRCNDGNSVEASDEGTLELSVKAFKDLWTARFMQLHTNEEELNRQFIDIYGLQDELTPDVPLKEITILQQGEISIEED